MLRFEERITLKKKSLTATEEKIIHQLKVQDKPFLLSMGELAMLSEVSEPSVVRLYKKLEYQSYQELKVALAQEMADMKPSSLEIIDIAKEDMAETIFEKNGRSGFSSHGFNKRKAFKSTCGRSGSSHYRSEQALLLWSGLICHNG